MFDLLPENLYSRTAVRWGLILSVMFIAAGVFAIHRQDYVDAIVDVVLGVAMLFIWGTRGLPQGDVNESGARQDRGATQSRI